MKTGIILYQSKYGATKQYATWLQTLTGFDCVQTQNSSLQDVLSYHTIILCGGVYASGIAGLSFFKKNINQLQGKKLAVLCVGASPYDADALAQLKEHNLTGQLCEIPLFYARGAWDEEKMTRIDRTLCKLLQKSIAKKDPATCEPWMKALLCAKGQVCDWTDRAYLTPLIKLINGTE